MDGSRGLCYNSNIDSMNDFEFTAHARDMLMERQIPEDWIWQVLTDPDKKELGADGNLHYSKALEERGGHVMHVVVNPKIQPNRIVTLFFDRRLTRSK